MRPSKRIYLVNRDFQLKYVLSLALVAILTTMLTIGVLLYPLFSFGILRAPQFLPPPILLAMTSAVAINAVLITLAGLFITHRIAGPMFAISKKLRAIERGHWNSPLQIRKNDDLKYLARTFNNAIEALVFQGQDLLSRIESLEQDLQSLDVSGQGDLTSVTKHLAALKQILNAKIKPQTGHPAP